MDAPVMLWLKAVIKAEDVAGARVLEVGSGDVNGSIRPHIEGLGCAYYLGVDIAKGRGVDAMVPADRLLETFGVGRFDVVVSTEMLEHVQDWEMAVWNMKAVLKPGGILVLSTRAPGFPRHCHPHDHWRFTAGNMRQILQDMEEVVASHVRGCGVVAMARKPMAWGEPMATMFILKDGSSAIIKKGGQIIVGRAPRRELHWLAFKVWSWLAYRGNPAAPAEPHHQSVGQGPCP